jgi:hypothetical protein
VRGGGSGEFGSISSVLEFILRSKKKKKQNVEWVEIKFIR